MKFDGEMENIRPLYGSPFTKDLWQVGGDIYSSSVSSIGIRCVFPIFTTDDLESIEPHSLQQLEFTFQKKKTREVINPAKKVKK
jgi:hypothetical protein